MNPIESEQQKQLDELIQRYPSLASCKQDIATAYCILRDCYLNQRKLLIAGNGGSAADAEHITGELMKSFKKPRTLPVELKQKLAEIDPIRGKHLGQTLERPLIAIALVYHEALSTAFLNDRDGKAIFAQQVLGYGREGDVFLGISTSGNSENVLYAAIMAKAMGMKVLALTGASGGKLKDLADVSICVPESETYKIQELHLPVYHCLCMMLENYFW